MSILPFVDSAQTDLCMCELKRFYHSLWDGIVFPDVFFSDISSVTKLNILRPVALILNTVADIE